MPPLRFPEFTDEWTDTTIGSIATVVGGGTPDTTQKDNWDGNILWYTPSEIGKEKYLSDSERRITNIGLKSSGAKLLPKGTILLTSRATIGECSIAAYECSTNQGFQSLIANQGVNNEFLFYLVASKRRELLKRACGSTFLEISANEVRKIKVKSPSIDEQNKIASLLALIDERIATQSRIIDKLQSLIKGIIQRLVHDGLEKETWHKVMLSEILSERNELNIEYYPVHSVSVSVGIVNQVEYLGRSFAAKDTAHYNVVKYGDIVYTKSPTGNQPFGIIRQSQCQNSVAVSPLYGVYKPDSFEIGNILHYYFLNPLNTNNYLFPLIQKGAKNTINITNRRFLENSIPLPISNDEILSVSKALSSLNTKIVLENNTLYTLLKQKRYLLNMLFI